MSAVYKYSVPVDDAVHDISIPNGASITFVACQSSSSVVNFWAHVDGERPTVTRRFRVVGTGHHINPDETVIGSTLSAQGALVWHLLEVSS